MRRSRQKRGAEKETPDSRSPPKKAKLVKKPKPSDNLEDDNDLNDAGMRNKLVMRLGEVVRAKVVNRPSKVVRSPYMADIIVEGEGQTPN